MKFVLSLLVGILQTCFCAVNIMDIVNGDHTWFNIFMTVFTGATAIAFFAAAFDPTSDHTYGGDDK